MLNEAIADALHRAGNNVFVAILLLSEAKRREGGAKYLARRLAAFQAVYDGLQQVRNRRPAIDWEAQRSFLIENVETLTNEQLAGEVSERVSAFISADDLCKAMVRLGISRSPETVSRMRGHRPKEGQA